MQDGVLATSYANGDKFYIDPMKLLPLDRFLPKPKGSSAGITKGNVFCLDAHCLTVHTIMCADCKLHVKQHVRPFAADIVITQYEGAVAVGSN